MKKIYLIILFVLLLPVASSFAITPPSETGQQILIPYAINDGAWWSGVAVHNTSAGSMSFSVGAYKQNLDGSVTWVNGVSFSVQAHAMEVRMLPDFFSGTPPTGRMSLLIRCGTDLAPTFQATLFVGNSEDGGFGFQNYTSFDWVHPIVVGPFDPTLPIFIPKFPF